MHFSSHTCRLHHARAQTPFIGKAAVRAFVEEFDFPGIKFIPEKFSEVRIIKSPSPYTLRLCLSLSLSDVCTS